MAKMTRQARLAKRKQQRDEAFSDMTPDLLEVYKNIKGKTESHSRREILLAYETGTFVRELTANERKYGEAAVPNLTLALGGEWTSEYLFVLRGFANGYSKKTVDKLTKKRMSGGSYLSLNHLLLLVPLTLSERSKWLKYVLEQDLTTVELAAAIREKPAKPPQRRKPEIRPPRGVLSGLSQICTFSDKLGKHVEVWDQHVFDKILKTSADDCTDELLDHLNQTVQAEQETIVHAERIIDRAEEAKERVKRVIELRKHGKSSRTSPTSEEAGVPERAASPQQGSVNRKKASVGKKRPKGLAPAKATATTVAKKKRKVQRRRQDVEDGRPKPT